MRSPHSVPAVALLLLLGVGVVLGGLLLFVRRESAAVGADPNAARTPIVITVAPRAVATSAPSSVPIVPTTAAPAPAATPIVATTPTPLAASPPGAQAAGTVVLDAPIVSVDGTLIVLLPGTPAPEMPWWQRAHDTPEPLVREVLVAYLHFWDVRSQALATLQTAALNEVLAAGPLQNELAAIERLRAQNKAQHVDVDHSITVMWGTENAAAVSDALLDRSTLVDRDPAQPTPVPVASAYRMAYQLRRGPSGWQVVDSVRITR